MPQALSQYSAEPIPQVRHQCGEGRAQEVRQAYASVSSEIRVDEFIEDMAEAYAWADVVVARSGAMTVSELAAAGVASILVPYPHAIDDHQTQNARFLVNNDAAILLSEPDFNAHSLGDALTSLTQNKSRVQTMAANAYALTKPDATERVVQRCMEVLGA